MIRSMTGFGAAGTESDGARYAVEIRTLNSKYLKTQCRIPEELQGLEAELESALSKHLSRGSAVITVRVSDTSAEAASTVNLAAVERYVEQLRSVDGLRGDDIRIELGALLSLPGVIITDTGEERLERARPHVMRALEDATVQLLAMRDREGEMLHRELHGHCETIVNHLSVVEGHVPTIIELYQQKLRQRMTALLAESGAAVREEDVLREVAVFAERSDIAEEVARLNGHVRQFIDLIDSDNHDPIGRTLDFIAQEMLREANTIGSKCLDVEVSRRIVEIKGAIDRIKEQAANVE